MRLAVIALLAASCGATPPRPAAPADPWDRVAVIETTATIEVGGMSGPATSLEDVATGRSRSEAHLGVLDQLEGFDGTTPWERAAGGEVQRYEGAEAVAHARTAAYVVRRGWRHPGGARTRDLGAQGGLRGTEVTPDGGAPIELWFDAQGRLARTRGKVGRFTVVTDYSDFRALPGAGVEVPFKIVVDQGDPRNKVTMTVTAAHARAALPATAFAPPAGDDRLRFANGATSTTVPFELIENHIYVTAQVDGKPVKMIFDTGGQNLLTPAAVARLGLTSAGAMAASGAGNDKVDVGFARAKEVSLGDIHVADPVFAVLDLRSLPDVEGVDLDGLVGYELFARLVVRVDYPKRTLTLFAPDAFTPPPGAIAVPFEMSDRIPIVHGAIDGVPGRFWIDTGSRSSLTTMSVFTRAHELEKKYAPKFTAVTGWGVGGPSRGLPVRFHEVTIGGAKVGGVVGDLFTGTDSALADPDAAANLGGGILHRFAVTFDYGRRTMYLEPGPDAGAPDVYDRSGLFLLRADGGKALRVGAVTPTGPAEKAGVREGDRIVAIDRAAVATKPVSEWRAYLRDHAPGTRVVLRIERDGKPAQDVAITLAELVP